MAAAAAAAAAVVFRALSCYAGCFISSFLTLKATAAACVVEFLRSVFEVPEPFFRSCLETGLEVLAATF